MNTFVQRNAQNRAPIVEALTTYRKVTRFHMPGHRGGTGADPAAVSFLGLKAYPNDVTGVPGLDDLHEPCGCIEEAQSLAAQAFGADRTFFSVNGTSGAIHTMVLSAIDDGDVLIIPRNIHKSVLGAIVLSGAKPHFVPVTYDPYLGLSLGVDPLSIMQCVESNPQAKGALLVNPTYYGTYTDLTHIAEALHSRNMVLLVDEAHGPHLRFHPDLPKPALDSGADAVAQGAHKLISAFTQASMLHVKGDRIDRSRLKAFYQYLATTSPSYLLLASLDAARRQMALKGYELLDRAINLAGTLRESISKIPGLYCFGEDITEKPGVDSLDPTKVTITVRDLGITGYQAEAFLRNQANIQVELSDLYNILVIVSFGNTATHVDRLLDGLKALVSAVREGEISRDLLRAQESISNLPVQPVMALAPKEASRRPWERVLLAESRGCISAEVVTCYPPGIPIVFPGEIISKEVVDYLEIVKKLAWGISGPEDRSLNTLRVVKEK